MTMPIRIVTACLILLPAASLATAAHGKAGKAAKPGPTLGARLRASAPGGSEKPGVPLRLVLTPEGKGTETEQAVRVTAEPRVACRSISLQTEAQDGLEITRGTSSWSLGATAKGRPVSRVLFLRATRAGEQRLQVTASIVLPDGTRLTTSATWAARPRTPSLSQEFPGSQRVRDGRGRDILELPPR